MNSTKIPVLTQMGVALAREQSQSGIWLSDINSWAEFVLTIQSANIARTTFPLTATLIRDRKGTPKSFCDKDFAELSGELSGEICLETLVLLDSAPELFRKFFGTVRAIFCFGGSFLTLDLTAAIVCLTLSKRGSNPEMGHRIGDRAHKPWEGNHGKDDHDDVVHSLDRVLGIDLTCLRMRLFSLQLRSFSGEIQQGMGGRGRDRKCRKLS